MVKPDESFDKAEDEELQIKPFNKKKVLIYVVPVIVVIGLAVSFITVFTRKAPPRRRRRFQYCNNCR